MALVVKVTCREEMEAGLSQHVVAVFGTFMTEFEHSMNRRDDMSHVTCLLSSLRFCSILGFYSSSVFATQYIGNRWYVK